MELPRLGDAIAGVTCYCGVNLNSEHEKNKTEKNSELVLILRLKL